MTVLQILLGILALQFLVMGLGLSLAFTADRNGKDYNAIERYRLKLKDNSKKKKHNHDTFY